MGDWDALFSSTKKETSYELFIQEANEPCDNYLVGRYGEEGRKLMRRRWSFRGRLLLLPGRRDSEGFGAIRSCCDLLLVIIPQRRFVHCMVSLISLFFISMLLWCGVFSDCVSSPSPIWWLGFPLAEISHLACCVLFLLRWTWVLLLAP